MKAAPFLKEKNWMVWVLLLAVTVNTVFIAHWEGLFRFPRETDDLTVFRQGARALYQHYVRQADAQGVLNQPKVQEALHGFKEEIDRSRNQGQLVQAIWASDLLPVEIAAARQKMAEEHFLQLLGRALQDQKIKGDGEVVLYPGSMSGASPRIEDPRGILSPGVAEHLKTDRLFAGETGELGEIEPIRVEVAGGMARPTRPQDLWTERMRLREEIHILSQAVDEVKAAGGYTTLAGSGILVMAYDAQRGYSWEEIVHDQNIRDIVNLLFTAGVQGIEVGGQRVTAMSSIRCVGPVILVNGQPVAPNPITIKAVGDQTRLKAALGRMQQTFAATGKRLEIKPQSMLTLTACQ